MKKVLLSTLVSMRTEYGSREITHTLKSVVEKISLSLPGWPAFSRSECNAKSSMICSDKMSFTLIDKIA